MEYGSHGGQRRPLGQDSFTGGSNAVTPPQLRSDLSMTGITDSGGMPESRLKIYSDLFEEVIERDRVFGSLLRKIKTAYDMLLLRSPAVPPLPMDSSSFVRGHGHEAMDQRMWGGQDATGQSSLHSNEPTTRAEGGQAWEMQRENRVLKDLVERLHLELEEAVRREHRWKQKVTKLKARADTSDSRLTPPQGMPGNYYSELAEKWLGSSSGMAGHGGSLSQAGFLQPDDRGYADKRASSNGAPRFHAMRREPMLGEGISDGQEGPLNQGGLLSLSSISPTASVPPLPESFAAESARSTDSGQLPQRPTRRHISKPDHVPTLDFSKLKDQLEDEDDEDDMPGEGHDSPDDQGYDDMDLDEMQAHGKVHQHNALDLDDGEDEDACWPSFERCRLGDGHISQAAGRLARPQNPIGYGYDDDDDNDLNDDDLHAGFSRHSH